MIKLFISVWQNLDIWLMIKPTDSFDDFFSFFFGSLDPNGEYREFFKPTAELFVEIVKTDYLPAPIQYETERFLDEMFPELIGRITRLGKLAWPDPICEFLSQALMLAHWAAVRDKVKLFPCFELIFSEETPIAKENDVWKKTFLPKMKEFVVSHEYLTIIAFRLDKPDPPPQIEHFLLFFSLFNVIGDKMSQDVAQELSLCAGSAFTGFLERVERDKVQLRELVRTCREAFKVCESVLVEEPLLAMLNLARDLFVRGSPDEIGCGAQIFGLFSSDGCPEGIKNMFAKFCEQEKISDLLFKRPLEPTVVVSFRPIILQAAEHGLITDDMLVKIWAGVETAPKEVRPQLESVIVGILKGKSPDEMVDVLRQLSRDVPTVSLSGVVKNLMFVSEKSIHKQLIGLLFEFIKTRQHATEQDKTDFLEMCQSSGEMQETIFDFCIDFAKQQVEPQSFYLSLLQEMIKSDLEKELADRCKPLIGLLAKTSHLEELLNVIAALISTKNIKLDAGLMEAILGVNPLDDCVWLFLAEQLKSGSAMDTEAYSLLVSRIEKGSDIRVTHAYLDMLQYLVLTTNLMHKKIKRERGAYRIVAPPLEMDEMMLDLFVNTSDDTLVSMAQQVIIDMYSQIADHDEICKQICKYIDTPMNDRALSRVLRLLLSYCRRIEKDAAIGDVGVVRHRETIDISGKTKVYINIKDDVDPAQFELCISTNVTAERLLLKIAPYLKDSPDQYQVNLGTNFKRLSGKLSNARLTNNSALYIMKIQNPPQTRLTSVQWPSVALANLGFLDKIWDILNSQHEAGVYEACTELLTLLPTSPRLCVLSAEPEELLAEKRNNIRQLMYVWEIIAWRVQASSFRSKYQKSKAFGAFASRSLRSSKLMRLCGSEILTTLLDVVPISENIEPDLLKVLESGYANEATKDIASQCLTKLGPQWVSEHLQREDIDAIIEGIVKTCSDFVWEKFKLFLWKLDSKTLFRMSLKHLSDPGPSHFKEIFAHFSTEMASECSPKDQLVRFLEFIENGYFDESTRKIVTLWKQNEKDFVDCEDIVKKVIHVLVHTMLPDDVERDVSDVLIGLSKSTANRRAVDTFMDRINSLIVDKWSVTPAEGHRTNLTGLRNLGATCYMNSVLQCLLRIPLFRKLVVEQESPSDESLKELQRLVHFIMFSLRRYCDTTSFCECWRGWGKQIVDPREQQDANEFLQMFLDQLPQNVNAILQGKLLNRIIAGKEQVDVPENFFSISLTVKDLKGVVDSLDLFAKDEMLVGENQYVLNGKRIDAKRLQRISCAPAILVLHLKRFEYDVRTHERIKINSRFEIPERLDLSPYMETHNSDAKYTLYGAVLHCGEVGSGHYTAFLRVESKWWKFNDMDVTLADYSAFEKESFGGGEARTSAYLLFYTKYEATDGDLDIMGNLDIQYSEKIKDEVLKDNEKFLFERCAFTVAVSRLFLDVADFTQLRDFYFKIHCHSRNGEMSDEFATRLSELVLSSPGEFIEWLKQNFEQSVIPVFVNCTTPDIVKSLSKLIRDLSRHMNDVTDAVDLIELFVFHLTECLNSWRQLPEVSSIIASWIKLDEKCLKAGQDRHWCRTIAEFIGKVFDGTRTKMFLESIDLRDPIECVSQLVSVDDADSVKGFPGMLEQANASVQNGEMFKKLLVKLTDMGILDISHMAQLLPNTFTQNQILELALKNIDESNFQETIQGIVASRKVSLPTVIQTLSKNASTFSLCLLANSDTLLRWLDDKDPSVRQSAAKVIKELDAKAVLKAMLKILREEKVGKEFLGILAELTSQLCPPKDQPYEGLEKQEQSVALYPLLGYFGKLDIVQICEGELAKLTLSMDKRKKIFELLPSIVTCTDTQFLKLMSSEIWRKSQECVFTSLNSDRDRLNELIGMMCARQSLTEGQPLLHELMMELILGKRGQDVSAHYLAGSIKWLEKVTDSITPSDFKQIHRLICSFLAETRVDCEVVMRTLVPTALTLLDRDDIKAVAAEGLETDMAKLERFMNIGNKIQGQCVQYIVHLCSLDKTLLTKLRTKIDAKAKSATSYNKFTLLFAQIGIHLLFLDPNVAEGDRAGIIVNYHREVIRFTSQSQVQQSELFKLYIQILRKYGGRDLPQWAQQMLTSLFLIARLTTDEEKLLFREWLPKMADHVDPMVQDVCKSVTKWTDKKNQEILPCAKRAAFLVDVLPEKKEDVLFLVGDDVIRSFPKNRGTDWANIVRVLKG